MKKMYLVFVCLLGFCAAAFAQHDTEEPQYTDAPNAYVFSFSNKRVKDNIVFENLSSDSNFGVRLYGFYKGNWILANVWKLKDFGDTDRDSIYKGKYKNTFWYALVPIDSSKEFVCAAMEKHHDMYVYIQDK